MRDHRSGPAWDCGGVTLWAPRSDFQEGARYRLRVRARDVGVALKRPRPASHQNVVSAKVAEIADDGGLTIDLLLAIGTRACNQSVWVRLSRAALTRLKLTVGAKTFALIKAASIDRHSFADRSASQEQSPK